MKKLLAFLLLPALAFSQNSARMISGVNKQTVTSYTFIAKDITRLTTFSNSANIAAALPSGLNAGFGIGAIISTQNLGPSVVTINCTLCIIFSSTATGSSALNLSPGQGVDLYSDGANWSAVLGGGNGGSSFNPPDPANFPGSVNIPGPVNIGNFQAIEFIPDTFCGFYGAGTGSMQQDQFCNLAGLPVWNANGTNQAFMIVAYSDYENTQVPPNGTVYSSNNVNGDFEQVAGVSLTTNQVQAQRFMVAGTAPTCTFTTGGGTLPSCTVDTGSTDSAGIIIATTGTGSPTGTGTITLTFSATFGTNKPVCEFQASDNVGGAWNGLAVMKDKTPSTTSDLFTYTNGTTPTALSASTAYRVNYQCWAK